MEILKKHGIPAGIATLLVLAITFVPVYYQYKYTREQNARITALEAKVASLLSYR
jgi:uncharacterized membrane protein YukC